MSGPICPDCGSFDIHRIDDITDRCGFCGWQGPSRPRRTLTPENQHRLAEENRKNKELKEAGNLFFLRIHLKEETIDYVNTRSKIYKILDRSEGIKYSTKQLYFFTKLAAKPSPESLEQLQSLIEVEKVELI